MHTNTECLFYMLLVIAILVVMKVERKEWVCENPHAFTNECKPAEGMPYRGSTPTSGDNCKELLHKIKLASKAERNSIKWRRSLSMMFIILLLCFYLVITPGSLPAFNIFASCLLIGTGVLYFKFNFYSYHMFSKAEENILSSVERLEKMGICGKA